MVSYVVLELVQFHLEWRDDFDGGCSAVRTVVLLPPYLTPL